MWIVDCGEWSSGKGKGEKFLYIVVFVAAVVIMTRPASRFNLWYYVE